MKTTQEDTIRYVVTNWPTPAGFNHEEDDPTEDVSETEEYFSALAKAKEAAAKGQSVSYWCLTRIHREILEVSNVQGIRFENWRDDDSFKPLEYDGASFYEN